MTPIAKTLRALSVPYVSLGALEIAIPLSAILIATMEGFTVGSWFQATFVHSVCMASVYAGIGTLLFLGYRFSWHDKRSPLMIALMWCVVLAAGIYGAFFIFRLLHAMTVHH